jgi:hypothetical protein
MIPFSSCRQLTYVLYVCKSAREEWRLRSEQRRPQQRGASVSETGLVDR